MSKCHAFVLCPNVLNSRPMILSVQYSVDLAVVSQDLEPLGFVMEASTHPTSQASFASRYYHVFILSCCALPEMIMSLYCAQVQVEVKKKPTAVKALSRYRVIDVALGPTHSAVLVEPGHVYTFGANSEGQLGCGNTKPRDAPATVKPLEEKTVTVSWTDSVSFIHSSSSMLMMMMIIIVMMMMMAIC